MSGLLAEEVELVDEELVEQNDEAMPLSRGCKDMLKFCVSPRGRLWMRGDMGLVSEMVLVT